MEFRCYPTIDDFNPRPYVRGDGIATIFDVGDVDFNPRPYGRGDARPSSARSRGKDFNPRPYVRGDESNRGKRPSSS